MDGSLTRWLAAGAVLAGALAGSAVALGAPVAAPSGATSNLARSAHALLNARCAGCHGERRVSGLDLRTRESLLRGGSHGPALVPQKPDESRLVQLLTGTGGKQMPPGKPLSAEEQTLLRSWITAGAPWPDGASSTTAGVWWSFRELSRPSPPAVGMQSWVRNPIDAFVLHDLEVKGLKPAPVADPRTLIRRLSFDLTGLPPSPEEVEAFVRECATERASRKDAKAQRRKTSGIAASAESPLAPNSRLPSPAQSAYERLVDRLLASPRYGERWGRHWLDVARFAESQGFERDKIRDHAWRYRDWVIQSLNADKPYDRFVQEQLAGDVLPDASRESIIATGFLVAGPWDEVGSTQASAVMKERVREDELEDMVSAVSQTFLGLTVNCARCHDHKFDPIPQKDYYRLEAALAGVRHGDRTILTPAEVATRDAELKQLEMQSTALGNELRTLEAQGRAAVLAARKQSATAAPEIAVKPVLRWDFEADGRDVVSGTSLTLAGGASVSGGRLRLNGKDGKAQSSPLPFALSTKTLEAWVSLAVLNQGGGSALTVESDNGSVFDAIVYGERQPKKWVAGSSGYQRTRDLSVPEESAAPAELTHLAITYGTDGRISVFRNGQPYGESYVPQGNDSASLRTYAAEHSRVLFGLRHTGAGSTAWLNGEIEEARVYDRALSAGEVKASFAAGPASVRPEELLAALSSESRTRHSAVESELKSIREQVGKLKDQPLVYAANPKGAPEVRLLQRGDVLKKADVVTPSGLSCIPALPGDLGLAADAPDTDRRRKLAAWITEPKNPLPARVMVNRVWQGHFGRGLVGTPSDFGINGELPSHPGLLDWLAAAFSSGETRGKSGEDKAAALSPLSSLPSTAAKPWSLKALHRLIVTSNTYKQSSRFDPAAASVDADNRLLWRFSPRRLDAEELRDALLFTSGQLNLQEGGPGFRAFNVEVSNTHFYTYEDKLGAEFNRRSIYRTVVNSAAVPLLEAFDCPDPSVKTPRRSTTTTPLQALVLLNNSFLLRQARELAQKVERDSGSLPVREVDLAYRRAFGRPPNAGEHERALAFLREHGVFALCRVLLNASEFVYVR